MAVQKLTIGYKEFADLELPQEHPATDARFQKMLDRMKVSTHQYAKSQIKWIKKQLLPAVKEAQSLGGDVHLYVVPGGPVGEAIAQTVLDGAWERVEATLTSQLSCKARTSQTPEQRAIQTPHCLPSRSSALPRRSLTRQSASTEVYRLTRTGVKSSTPERSATRARSQVTPTP